jgi:hypothetical protein
MINTRSISESFARNSVFLRTRKDLYRNADSYLETKQKLEGSFLNIKSTAVRGILREVLKGVTCVSLREDKPSVSIFLKIKAISGFPNILRRSI